MDFNSLKDQVSNLTLYDLKAGVRKVQNAVMNYTEMEAKVREATNNEPWGASSTIMQEIANGTYSYQLLNEIMPMIYKRFTEKSAEEWRQIYKALQLLEFLIKNGSERVIDDARSHLSLLKMLRQFQFYDQNGKDQGANVRNRAKELGDLLSDVDKIRAERKKAKSNRNKFGGVEGGSGFSSAGGMGGGSRYGGFGSEDASFGGHAGGVYGDGGGFGGQEASYASSGGRKDQFEEYDEGDDGPSTTRTTRHTRNTSTTSAGKRKVEEPKQKAPEIDLFEFGEEEPAHHPPPQSAGLRSNATDDDDFDDFISATPAPATNSIAASISSIAPPKQTSFPISNTAFAAPKPVSASQATTLSGLANYTTMSPAPSTQSSTPANGSAYALPAQQFSQPMQPLQTQAPKPSGYQASQPNYFTSVQAQPQASSVGNVAKSALSSTTSLTGNKPATGKTTVGADAFSNLWSSASTSAGVAKKAPSQGPNLASLAKEKTQAGIWGPSASSAQGSRVSAAPPQQKFQQPPASQSTGGGLDDLLG